jgi:hypothetical protein
MGQDLENISGILEAMAFRSHFGTQYCICVHSGHREFEFRSALLTVHSRHGRLCDLGKDRSPWSVIQLGHEHGAANI